MPVYFIEDVENAKRNQITGFGSNGIAYNAVLSVDFSDESTTEPVTLQEAKDWCRIDVADDDAIITALITAARIICEKHVNLSLIERTVTARFLNGLGNITLPYGPVTGDVEYTDSDSVSLTDYDLRTGDSGEVTAVYTAGYETLPENLRTAILTQIAWMYDNRGDAKLASGLSELSKLILNPLRSV